MTERARIKIRVDIAALDQILCVKGLIAPTSDRPIFGLPDPTTMSAQKPALEELF